MDRSKYIAALEHHIFAGANPMVRGGCFVTENEGCMIKDVSMC